MTILLTTGRFILEEKNGQLTLIAKDFGQFRLYSSIQEGYDGPFDAKAFLTQPLADDESVDRRLSTAFAAWRSNGGGRYPEDLR